MILKFHIGLGLIAGSLGFLVQPAIAQNFLGFDTMHLLPTSTNLTQRSFTAVGDLELHNGNINAKISVGLSIDNGNLRAFVDYANGFGGLFQRRDITALKQMGVDKIITIQRPDINKHWEIYPTRQAYLETLFMPEKNNGQQPSKVFQGKETIDGHPCCKYQLDFPKVDNPKLGAFSDDLAETVLSGTEWDATDLDNFPIQIEVSLNTKTEHIQARIHYRNIKLGRCDPELFEVPTNYTRFASMDEMLYLKSTGQTKAVSKTEMNARVLKWNQEQADKGDAYGELRMGLRYRDGDGVPKDLNQARKWLQKAAAQGDPEAVAALARLPKPKISQLPTQLHSAETETNFVLTTAKFGMGKKEADVTERVTELLRDRPEGFIVNAQTLGADPLPGKKKRLVVKYECQSNSCTVIIPAGKRLSRQRLVNHSER